MDRDEQEINFSFAGCGFLGIYHVGVASCLYNNARHLVDHCHFSGASAGAMIAACLMCDVCLGDCTTFTLRLATEARSHMFLGPFHPSYQLVPVLEKALHDVLPDNAHEIVSGRLHVSFTKVINASNRIVSHFKTKDDLIQALLCSAHIPLYSGIVPKTFEGKRYVDGGLSNNIPIVNEHTVTVSPFAGQSDICPQDPDESTPYHMMIANTSFQITYHNLCRLTRALWPMSPKDLLEFCDQGYTDTLLFLQKNNLIRCERHVLFVRGVVNDGILSELEVSAPDTSRVEQSERKQRPGSSETVHSASDTEGPGDVSDESVSKSELELGSEGCLTCKQRTFFALKATLPKKVQKVLNAAVDDQEKYEGSFLFRFRPIRYLWRLANLHYLPAQVTFILTLRGFANLPNLPGDALQFGREMLELFRFLTVKLYEYGEFDKHMYNMFMSVLHFGTSRIGIPTIQDVLNDRKYQVTDIRKKDQKKQEVTGVERTSNGEKNLANGVSENVAVPKTGSVEKCKTNTKRKSSEYAMELCESGMELCERLEDYDTHERLVHASIQMDILTRLHYGYEQNLHVFHVRQASRNTEQIKQEFSAKPVKETAKHVMETAKPVKETAKSVKETAKPVKETAKPVKETLKTFLEVVNEQESAISSYYEQEGEKGSYVFADAIQYTSSSELYPVIDAYRNARLCDTEHEQTRSLETLLNNDPQLKAAMEKYIRCHTDKVKHDKRKSDESDKFDESD